LAMVEFHCRKTKHVLSTKLLEAVRVTVLLQN